MIHFSPAATTIIIMSLFLSAFAGAILLYSNIRNHKKHPL